MIVRDDILSMEYLKKTEFTGCHQGMRYRLEKVEQEEQKFLDDLAGQRYIRNT